MTSTLTTDSMNKTPPAGTSTVKVWDPFVRIFHWSLVAGFTAAWITGDEFGKLHEQIGYAIIGLIAARVVWGFIGTRHARFSSFAFGPSKVLTFLRQSMSLSAPRHLGHNPAGGAMVFALLAAIAAICASGYAMTTDAYWGVKWVEEVHETAVWIATGLVVLHVAGVILASVEHGENLVRAMITGRKRAEQ
ncbi:MAG: cytochrome b/b6 domain-containing protein [Zhengella sp.]|uniref:cytochrome b/b6 domain-containing protein n=1 Tax=Zhengella sp. TaxID=2282762 RepID=UPI003529A06D